MEERKYVIIDTTSVPMNAIDLNTSFNRLYDNMKSRGIDITATGLTQCIDVYLRVLCFCRNIRSITDLSMPARERLYCAILDIEIAREDYDKCRCDIDAYSMKDAFITMVTMIVHHRFTQTDIFNIMANVDDIFNEIARFVEEVVDFTIEKLSNDSIDLQYISLACSIEEWIISFGAIYHDYINTNKVNIYVSSYKEEKRRISVSYPILSPKDNDDIYPSWDD